MALEKTKFSKPPIGLDEQVALLTKRGLNIGDVERAKHYLRFIGYYRLSGYFRFFAKADDAAREQIKLGTTFDDVLSLYIFDRKMRVQLMDAFERIEIAVKAALSHEGAMRKGAFWLCDARNFDHDKHAEIMRSLKEAVGTAEGRRQHLFIAHFYAKYSDEMPPFWMITEALSFGQLSRIYQAARGELQTAIAQHFNLNRTVLESWLHALTFGRNVCAHNCRVWNRTFTIRPKIPHLYTKLWSAGSHDRLYTLCCLIHHMMDVISDGTAWSDRLRALVNERGTLPLSAMGFPEDWEANQFWNFKPSL